MPCPDGPLVVWFFDVGCFAAAPGETIVGGQKLQDVEFRITHEQQNGGDPCHAHPL